MVHSSLSQRYCLGEVVVFESGVGNRAVARDQPSVGARSEALPRKVSLADLLRGEDDRGTCAAPVVEIDYIPPIG